MFCIKSIIPIIFGILSNLTFLTLSVLAFIGRYPIKNKNDNLGILFAVVFLFAFYPGMLLGKCISYFFNICTRVKNQDPVLTFETKGIKRDIKKTIKNQKQNQNQNIDF
jgi:hypothetical protein